MTNTPEYQAGLRHGLQIALDALQELQACSSLSSETDRHKSISRLKNARCSYAFPWNNWKLFQGRALFQGENALALASYLADHVLPALNKDRIRPPRVEHLQFMVDEQGYVRAHSPKPEPLRFISAAELLKDVPKERGAGEAEGCNLSWPELAELEPRLADLLREAEAVRDLGGPYFCTNRIWYAAFKPRLQVLVGRHSDHNDPRIRTMCSYSKAYHTIYHALPNCRNCVCH